MEDEPLDNEIALREEIVGLNERVAMLRRELGALEKEVRLREGQFIAMRAGRTENRRGYGEEASEDVEGRSPLV